jgi:hypothetical protein
MVQFGRHSPIPAHKLISIRFPLYVIWTALPDHLTKWQILGMSEGGIILVHGPAIRCRWILFIKTYECLLSVPRYVGQLFQGHYARSWLKYSMPLVKPNMSYWLHRRE